MVIMPLAVPGSEIPDSPAFKTAFIAVTIIYIIAMIVIFLLLMKQLKKLPDSLKRKRVRSKSHTHRQPESETETGQ